jgi:hypothetical protein
MTDEDQAAAMIEQRRQQKAAAQDMQMVNAGAQTAEQIGKANQAFAEPA